MYIPSSSFQEFSQASIFSSPAKRLVIRMSSFPDIQASLYNPMSWKLAFIIFHFANRPRITPELCATLYTGLEGIISNLQTNYFIENFFNKRLGLFYSADNFCTTSSITCDFTTRVTEFFLFFNDFIFYPCSVSLVSAACIHILPLLICTPTYTFCDLINCFWTYILVR